MDFYSDWNLRGNRLQVRGYNFGSTTPIFEEKRIDDFTIYTSQKQNGSPCEFKSLQGEDLYEINFTSSKDVRSYVNDAGKKGLFGQTKFDYKKIDELFPGASGIKFDVNLIRKIYIDIETESENGWPQIDKPEERVNLITLYFNGKYLSLGLGDAVSKRADVIYRKYETEVDLFNAFRKAWITINPDVVTGWNIDGFDMPYIVARSRVLFGGDDWIKSLSPFGTLRERELEIFGKEVIIYDLGGITNLDYLHLYKKFSMDKLPSYSLESVAQHELKIGKDKNPFDTMKEWYQKDFQSFFEYNVVDTERVYQIDQKCLFMNLVLTIAYRAKVRYVDVFSQVAMWETMIYNYLKAQRKVIAPLKTGHHKQEIRGGFVKLPTFGLYKWTATFDATSLYPSLMMMLNISPDTLVGFDEKSPEDFLGNFEYQGENKCMAANGAIFRTDVKGFLPEMIESMFAERSSYKNQMKAAEKKLQAVLAELKKRGIEDE